MSQKKTGKSTKRRIDELLVERGLVDGLKLAHALIMAGKVVAGDQKIEKASDLIDDGVAIRVKEKSRYVSRAGDKLHHALEDLGMIGDVAGKVVLDVGASTGGFTQCCLALGAAKVLALDVGINQLAWELRTDPRVIVLEQTDVRVFEPQGQPPIDLVVADVSFNSLARLAPALRTAAPASHTLFLLMVKPQFELPRALVPDGGVVEDETLRDEALTVVKSAFEALGLKALKSVEARVKGRSGNQEIFLLLG